MRGISATRATKQADIHQPNGLGGVHTSEVTRYDSQRQKQESRLGELIPAGRMTGSGTFTVAAQNLGQM